MIVFLGFAVILMIPLGVYLYFIIKRLLGLFLGDGKKRLCRVLSMISAVLVTVPSVNLFGLWALLVLYFTAVTACIDILRLFMKKAGCRPHKAWSIAYRSGAAAAAVTAAVAGYAYVNMHQVRITRYTVSAQKDIRPEGYRIVFVSDLHFGTTMDIGKLREYCGQMEAEKPDLVVLGGDIVDEATPAQDARDAFEALAQIDSMYGTYYVYGNHDKGRYSRTCDFTIEELAALIEESGVHILEDDTVLLNEELSISGRRDRSDAAADQISRASAQALLENIPQESFHIAADHQPRDMEENARAGFDLMLSGHTHAGQMWPVGLITTLFDKGTLNYGQKTYGGMELIVSSGIAGWGYPLRTGKHSEFVVVQAVKMQDM